MLFHFSQQIYFRLHKFQHKLCFLNCIQQLLVYQLLVLLVFLQELVEWSQLGQLHDQHEALCLTYTDHPDDIRVVQLLHDIGFSQHFIGY